MDSKERTARINELAKKKRTEGLTEEEQAEQQQLRTEYLLHFRQGMEDLLQNIIIKEPDGTTTPLKKKSSP